MTFGKKTLPERAPRSVAVIALAARWAIAWALCTQVLPASAFSLPELMALLGQQRSGEARFTEQRFVDGFDAPLASSGTLRFDAPDRLVRKTLQPRAETMAVEGNTVTLSRGTRSRSFSLDAAPEMRGLIEALRGTLSGNTQTVARFFNPELSGSAEQWTLALTPLEARLGELLRSIRISGRRAEVMRIETLLADGDRSLMLIEPIGRLATAPVPVPDPARATASPATAAAPASVP